MKSKSIAGTDARKRTVYFPPSSTPPYVGFYRRFSQAGCLLVLLVCGLVAEAFAGLNPAVDALIPRLGAQKIEERYSAQMELQGLAANAARPGAEAERAKLAKVIAARAADDAVPQPARVWLARQLEFIGAAESVKALTALLNGPDAELRECARRALERNPASAAAASLRAALKRGGDVPWQIGLINSLGERGDASSASAIAHCLANPELSPAAASALGKIASVSAVKELWAAFDRGDVAAGDALVTAANRLAAKSQARKARTIYARLYTSRPGAAWRPAVLTGLAKTDPKSAGILIPQALSGDDLKLQAAAIAAARAVWGQNASTQLASLLPTLNASARVLVLSELDASAEKQVMEMFGDTNAQVRMAAFDALGRVGGPASVPILVKTAAESPSAEQKAAAEALARISSPGVDDAIKSLAGQGGIRSRCAAIHALAQRHDQTAAPTLLGYASDPKADAALRAAACDALGQVGADAELDPLVQLALKESPRAAEAARLVAGRANDKAATAKRLLALVARVEPQQLVPLFGILGGLGGQEALTAVSSSASSSNEQVKDAAIRELAGWTDFAAAKPLLAIAAAPETKLVHNTLAIGAVARLVTDSENESKTNRLEAALAALSAARRPEEKKLVLSALGTVSLPKTAAAIKPLLGDPELRTEAGLAGVALAETLVKTDGAAAKDLAQTIKEANLSEEITRRAEVILSKRK